MGYISRRGVGLLGGIGGLSESTDDNDEPHIMNPIPQGSYIITNTILRSVCGTIYYNYTRNMEPEYW